MTDKPTSDGLRIGDTERENAIAALGEHLSSGRLTIDEYGERSARATQAVVKGDLRVLFADLPLPHPDLGDEPGTAIDMRKGTDVVPKDEKSSKPVRASGAYGPLLPRVVNSAAAVTGVLWLILMMTGNGHLWWLMFVPGAMMVFSSTMWPDEKKKGKNKKARRIENRPHADLESDAEEVDQIEDGESSAAKDDQRRRPDRKD